LNSEQLKARTLTAEEINKAFIHLNLPGQPVRAVTFTKWFHSLIGGEQHGYSRIFIKLLIRLNVFAFYTIAVIDQLEADEYKEFRKEFDKIRKHING
jgi:hypothetical protein